MTYCGDGLRDTGRVINVEKSAGGKDAEKRKQKITGFRQQQNEKIKAIITNILNEYEGKKVIKVSSKVPPYALLAFPALEVCIISLPLTRLQNWRSR
jgi:hypothetical protein